MEYASLTLTIASPIISNEIAAKKIMEINARLSEDGLLLDIYSS